MTDPILRVAASGMDGSGYRIPTRESGPKDRYVVVGVTTVLKAIDKPAIVQWSVDQVAAYAVTHVDDLLNRTEEQGYGFLRWYPKRAPKEGDPLRGAHLKVLNDAAELGTNVHEWIETYLDGDLPPDHSHPEAEEMADEFLFWESLHDLKVEVIEGTMFNPDAGYAGTFDLLIWINGELWLLDIKTSRNTWDENKSQLAALAKAKVWLRQVDKDTDGAVEYEVKGKKTYWVEAELPVTPTRFGLLHLRPWDIDKDGVKPAFCELKEVSAEELEYHYEVFLGALHIKKSQLALKNYRKSANVADTNE